MKHTRIMLLVVLSISLHSISFATDIFLEAENFENKGGWILDQQFMDQMGSPYLIAHGMGNPVNEASTKVNFPETGTYHIYVRTFNWTSPWTEKEGPGKFTLMIDNKKLPTVLGSKGTGWYWQPAGKVKIKKQDVTVSLVDLSGFDGRCDAVYFTTEDDELPPLDIKELSKFRKSKLNLPTVPTETEFFDFVVVGGGIAGMCAAATASRSGCKVALINNRPILGGNNSSEIRVHLGGSIELGVNKGLGRIIREFGHSKSGNAQPASNYEDEKKSEFIANEKNVSLYLNYHAIAVEMNANKITSIIIKHTENGKEIRLKAPLFSDCTGDGTIGYLAGADYRMGRESRYEFGEELAPEIADNMTMGVSIQWYSKDVGRKAHFPEFNYGVIFNEENCEKLNMGEWKWETGMNFNQIDDFERIRDYGLMVVYSNWSFLKNGLKDNIAYQNRALDWVACIAGKRESRRLLGDYILKQDDIDKNVFHEDGSFTTSWSIDLHFPDPENSEKFPGAEFKAATKHIQIYPYAVPYRCLYSRNVDNLFMAGRDISVTHVALGTVRVMRTTGMMGEVVGMAASLCKKHDTTPRNIYQKHLNELKEMMQEGAGEKENLPDNQHFNEQKFLRKPRALKE